MYFSRTYNCSVDSSINPTRFKITECHWLSLSMIGRVFTTILIMIIINLLFIKSFLQPCSLKHKLQRSIKFHIIMIIKSYNHISLKEKYLII